MSARLSEPCDGRKAALLRACRALPTRDLRAVVSAMNRIGDGQPFEAALIEMHVEWGLSLSQARHRVSEALRIPSDWRKSLD